MLSESWEGSYQKNGESMNKPLVRATALVLVIALTFAPLPSLAIAPLVLVFVKQMVKDTLVSELKSMLLSSLQDMGCKGIALSNALLTLDGLKGGGSVMGGVPDMAALTGSALPGVGKLPAMPGGGLPEMPSLPMDMAGGAGGFGALAGLPQAGAMMGGPEMADMMKRLPGGASAMTLGPEEMAMMAQMQAVMAQPPSPADTLATIDELREVGFLSAELQGELKECMVLIPEAAPALGMGMGMFKTVLPQMKQARAEIQALSPEEQDELAATVARELENVPASERKLFLNEIGGGFFPARVVEGVKASLDEK